MLVAQIKAVVIGGTMGAIIARPFVRFGGVKAPLKKTAEVFCGVWGTITSSKVYQHCLGTVDWSIQFWQRRHSTLGRSLKWHWGQMQPTLCHYRPPFPCNAIYMAYGDMAYGSGPRSPCLFSCGAAYVLGLYFTAVFL